MKSSQLQSRNERLMPGGIPKWIRCYDNGGKTADRYTIVFTRAHQIGCERGAYRSCNSYPTHPQGIGMWGEGHIDRPTYSHLGKRIQFQDLPVAVQDLIRQDYKECWKLT